MRRFSKLSGRVAGARWRWCRSPGACLRSRARPSPTCGTTSSAGTRSSPSSRRRWPAGTPACALSVRGLRLDPRRRRARGRRRAPRQAPGARGRRRHLGDGLLRELHARRAAGQRVVRAGRGADRVADLRRLRRPGGATATGLGMPNLPSRSSPATSTCRPSRSCGATSSTVTLEVVIHNLTETPARPRPRAEPGPRDIVFKGTLEEVNRFFYRTNGATACRSCRPPLSASQEFLAFTDRGPDEELGMLLPDRRSATVWSVAVNGVMAGCRPEYMPVPGRAGRGDGRPALRRRAQRQHAGRRDAHHRQRADREGARLQLQAGRAARRLPGQHLDRALLAPGPAQRGRLPAAQGRTRGRSAIPGAWCSPRTRTSAPASGGPPSPRTGACRRHQRRDHLALHGRGRAGLGVRPRPEQMVPYLADAHCAPRRLGGHVHLGMADGQPSARCSS